jgi:type II secretory ATPase GspE/PulE/Tfp pilus assembly ATPase PilB-like protein
LKASGYAGFQVELLEDATSKTEGIIVFAGPTGSGKSTTMSGILSTLIHRCNGTKHFVTVENPVEYLISAQIKLRRLIGDKIVEKQIRSYATQIPITGTGSKKTKEKFSDTIRSLMRLAPDGIMIGEVRDGGSVKAAVDASLTGHFVATSTHASYASQILKRLMTVGSTGEEQIGKEEICDASVFTCFICQRLVKTLCTHCSKPLVDNLEDVDKTLVSRLKDVYDDDLSGIRIHGDGCPKCGGLFGRTVLAEIISTDQPYMENYLKSVYEAETYWLKELNGIPMKAHGIIKVKNGLVDPRHLEGVLGKIQLDKRINKEYLLQLIKQEANNES